MANTCQTQQDIGNSVQHNGKNLSDTTGHWELCLTQWQKPVRHNRTLGTLFNTMAKTCQTQQDIGNSVQHNGKHMSDTTGHWELCSTQWQTPVRHSRTLGTLFNTMANTCQTQQDIGNSVQHNGKNLSDTAGHWELCSTQWQKPVRSQQDIGNSVQHNGKNLSDTTGHWELCSTQWQNHVRHNRTLGTLFNTMARRHTEICSTQQDIGKYVQHHKALKNMSLEC